jgi:hypothetical protein
MRLLCRKRRPRATALSACFRWLARKVAEDRGAVRRGRDGRRTARCGGRIGTVPTLWHEANRYRQRCNTVMIRAPKRFLDQVLSPEFSELNQALQAYLHRKRCDQATVLSLCFR